MGYRSRFGFRLLQGIFVLINFLKSLFVNQSIKPVKHIAIIHQLLLGDTLMLTGLLAKARALYPEAKISIYGPTNFQSLYSSRPYQVSYYALDTRSIVCFWKLRQLPKIDLALIPGDNRYGWLAFSLGAHQIIGFKGDRPAYKNWIFTRLIEIPTYPLALPDLFMRLLDSANNLELYYQVDVWKAPDYSDFDSPSQDYIVLHVGAKSLTKKWPKAYWLELIEYLRKHYYVVISCGSNELADMPLDINKVYSDIKFYAGNLSLPQLWQLVVRAKLVICLDNGFAHLARLTGVKAICLFGPGNYKLYGTSAFFSKMPFYPISNVIDCRQDNTLFKRSIDWVKTCNRPLSTCVHQDPLCIKSISASQVVKFIESNHLIEYKV